MNDKTSASPILIWDLPTRLFHFLLILCCAGLFVSGEIGGDAMRLHFYLGYTVLTLVFFRLAWGVVGGHWSRFATFVPSAAALRAYIESLRTLKVEPSVGHNPLGALSVLTLLLVLLAQVFSGLLSDDEISANGPWTSWAPSAWIEWATLYHTEIGQSLLIVLVVLHVCAVLFHKYMQGDDLISPMISGNKVLPEELTASTPASADSWVTRTKALMIFALSAYAVYRVVNLSLAL